MKLIREGELEPKQVPADAEGNPAEGTWVQVLIPDGPNFVMRVFAVRPGGHTPRHSHPWEHEAYVLSGNGRVEGDGEFKVSRGDAVFVAPDELHSFVNTGEEDLRFICVVPKGAR